VPVSRHPGSGVVVVVVVIVVVVVGVSDSFSSSCCCCCITQRTPMSASYPGDVSSHPVRGGRPGGAGVPAASKKSSSTVDGDVVGRGGRVEDGTAWSMIARFQCSVPGCGASFTRKQNLLRHQTQKHGRPKSHARNSTADDCDDDDEDDEDDDGSGAMAMPMFY